jgi:KaiC/GvpD/RAD55 family RecA-like ATPase
MIAPQWLLDESKVSKVLEGEFTEEEIETYNKQGYNVYYLPNPHAEYDPSKTVDGSMIDTFNYVFVDCDLKDKVYLFKESFLDKVLKTKIDPTFIVDSGNGIHVYWKVSNLDPMSYLRFQRRLTRLYKTDSAVGQLFQLMRLPGTLNTKAKDNIVKCEIVTSLDIVYTAEEFDKLLPPITKEDETYCVQHYNRTYNIGQELSVITGELPQKFGSLLRKSKEANSLWLSNTEDRSADDFKLALIMNANGFTREEAANVLSNTSKSSQRSPVHRISYATNIIDKIWKKDDALDFDESMFSTVKDILIRGENTPKGTRFACHKWVDNTQHGFRLGQVIGLVAGSGVGKTSFALNMFKWFVQENSEYHHLFVSLEQPENEIADRWQTMCGENTALYEKVHIMSNYDQNSVFRNLSLSDIKNHILSFQKTTGRKIGCVVVDHIGVLNKKDDTGKNIELPDICKEMKSFATETNTLLIMQSQTSREKAGIGDLELNKDAAYGTMNFESFTDYLITLWQPLKRCHSMEECPTITAFKFCKIRHKKARKDKIQEDVPYYLYFDSDKELMRELTQKENDAFMYYLSVCTNLRKADRKTDLVQYQTVPKVEMKVPNARLLN